MKSRPTPSRRTGKTRTPCLTLPRSDGKRAAIRVDGDTARWVVRAGQALEQPPAFAKGEALLREAEGRSARHVAIRDLRDPEAPSTWHAPLAAFFGPESFELRRGGFEVQRALPLSARVWRVQRAGTPAQVQLLSDDAEHDAAQHGVVFR